MQKCEVKPPNENLLFLDFECSLENNEHTPNFCVIRDFFGKEVVFDNNGDSVIELVGNYIFNEQHEGYTVISHYSSKYDSVFLLRYLLINRPTADIHCISSGQKLIQVYVNDYKIRLIDSFNWLQMSLDKLPETFGLDESKFKKGTFPHKFNQKINWDYSGSIPSLDYFMIDQLSEEKREELIRWHTQVRESNYQFNFRKELELYCSQDVSILRTCSLKFRKIFIEKTEIDAFNYCTIASTCLGIYRSKYLPENHIGIVPNHHYRGVHKQYSRKSIQWLDFIMHKTKQYIRHAVNSELGEFMIHDEEYDKTYFVDGVGLDEDGNERYLFEFLGCFYHSCLECFDKNDKIHNNSSLTVGDRYNETMNRLKRLEALGYKVKYIWEHDFDKLVKTKEMKHFLSTHEVITPLSPRESLFGGRTEAFRLYHNCEENEKIRYYDFTSLYPFVNKTKAYPKGHPKIIKKDFDSIDKYFGLIKCRILAPSNLFIPVLCQRFKTGQCDETKLMFSLCSSCTMSNSKVCQHNEHERSLLGTWTTIEVQKAIEKGYKILKIFEIWHFEEQTNDLFKEYVDYFVKRKTEASGYPVGCVTTKDKENYVKEYERLEGIKLDSKNIKKNKGLRSIAKSCANNLWGRFAMRTDRLNTEFVHDQIKFYDILHDAQNEIHDINILTEESIEITYKKIQDRIPENKTTNVFIGIFTTAWARLLLYDVLDRVGENCLYADTDSCIFIENDSEKLLKTGKLLGELTDEIESDHGQGSFIQTFIGLGPKNYSYLINNGKSVTKIKGFTLNYRTKQILNFHTLKDIVANVHTPQEIIISNPSQIFREKQTRKILNKDMDKKYRFVFDKRIILDDQITTVPYGYYWEKPSRDPEIQSNKEDIYTGDLVPMSMMFSETSLSFDPKDNNVNNYSDMEESEEEFENDHTVFTDDNDDDDDDNDNESEDVDEDDDNDNESEDVDEDGDNHSTKHSICSQSQENTASINLFLSSESESSDSEHSSDREFMDDDNDEIYQNDLSFYRRLRSDSR